VGPGRIARPRRGWVRHALGYDYDTFVYHREKQKLCLTCGKESDVILFAEVEPPIRDAELLKAPPKVCCSASHEAVPSSAAIEKSFTGRLKSGPGPQPDKPNTEPATICLSNKEMRQRLEKYPDILKFLEDRGVSSSFN
jgi:hypothetical protein